jgi:hypothetical protein
MSEGLEKIEQIINDIRSLENTGYLPLFNKRYAELLREISSKRTQSGKRKKRVTPVISEEEKARRHKENLKKKPPGWSSLPNGKTITVKKKNDKIPPNMPHDYGIDVYKSGPVNRRLSDWQEKDSNQRKWSVMRNE